MSEIASKRCCVEIAFQKLDKVGVISINYCYCFIVIGGATFGRFQNTGKRFKAARGKVASGVFL